MNPKPLMDLIAKGEVGTAGPEGYNIIYSGAAAVMGGQKFKLVDMTLDEIRALQDRMVAAQRAAKRKNVSSAIGRPQFLRMTLDGLRMEMDLSGSALFDAAMQDRLMLQLMKRRGLLSYMNGTLSRERFANNLAMEWASLPVVTDTKRDGITVKKGNSYYSGVAGNKSTHRVEDVLLVLDQVKREAPTVVPPPDVEPAPAAPPTPAPKQPIGLGRAAIYILGLIIALIAGWLGFGR